MKNDQPYKQEIEDMILFCRKYDHIYIYGCAEKQEYLLKFLDICDVKIDGYIVFNHAEVLLTYRDIPIFTINDVILSDDCGVLFGLAEIYYNDLIAHFNKVNFNNYFCLSEHNQRTIAHKMTPRARDRMWIEINLVDHCNLNCQMCDHFSQIADKHYLNVELFRRDMERLAQLAGNHVGIIKLQGGEPLLHKDINQFFGITRKLFPHCHIFLFTNGLLLMKLEDSPHGNFWKACKDNNVEIQLTTYPIKIDIEAIEKKADEYGVKMAVFASVSDRKPGLKFSTKHPLDLSGQQEKYSFISCYQFNESIVLKDGKLYTCPMIPYIHHFNKAFGQNMQVSEDDYIDIYGAKRYEELSEFVAKRVPFCRYCDVKHRSVHKWQISQKKLDEYIAD
jgi:organic radical activating enzyme